MITKTHARIHRFRDKVAISLGTGDTIYLSEKMAVKLAAILLSYADDIKTVDFIDSEFNATEINEG